MSDYTPYMNSSKPPGKRGGVQIFPIKIGLDKIGVLP